MHIFKKSGENTYHIILIRMVKHLNNLVPSIRTKQTHKSTFAGDFVLCVRFSKLTSTCASPPVTWPVHGCTMLRTA